MGWTDLFKSKTAKLAPDPSVRWFGKLPTYPDYYSSKADESWVVEFNDWVLRGYERFLGRLEAIRADAAPDGSRPDRRLEPAGCIIRLPESGMTVFTSIQDFGGDMRGRPFPLCLYAAVPTAQWPGPGSAQMLSAMRVVRDLTAMRSDVVRFVNSPGRFDTVFEDRQVDLTGIDAQTGDEAWVGPACEVALDDWYARSRPPEDGVDCRGWLRRLGKSGRGIAALDDEDFEATLCFPLSAGLAWDVQTAGWIRWLESYMDLTQRHLSLVMAGEPDSGRGRLVVIARKAISEEAFLLLTPIWDSLSYVDDLTGPGPGEEVASSDGAEAQPLPEPHPAASWGDFVRARAPVC